MELLTRIEEDYKAAFKAKDEVGKSSLGNLKAALKSAQIDKQKELSAEEIVAVIAKKVKQHKDSIAEFEKGGRADLVANETAQMKILQKYLPESMSEERVTEIVKQVITDLAATPADFGKVMKEVLNRVKGQADGSVVSKIVKQELK